MSPMAEAGPRLKLGAGSRYLNLDVPSSQGQEPNCLYRFLLLLDILTCVGSWNQGPELSAGPGSPI